MSISKGYNIKRKKMAIQYSQMEWLSVIVLFIFSLINSITLLIFMFGLLGFFYQKQIGAIKIMILLSLRSIINSGIGVNIESFQLIKLGIIFICSFYLLLGYRGISSKKTNNVDLLLFSLIIFGVYAIVSSWIFSTLPVVAVFKVISYIIPFSAIIIGISLTINDYNWVNWLNTMFMIVIVSSLFLRTNPIGYLTNGFSFQGITNQPNMFGIILVLGMANLYSKIQMNVRSSFVDFCLIVLIYYQIILSNSRTAFISAIVLTLIFLMLRNITLKKRIIILLISTFVLFSLLLLTSGDYFLPLYNFIEEFLYKGQTEILFSRSTQISSVLDNFYRNPLFGSGFAVPLTPNRSYSFSTDYPVEPGNLLFSVLAYSGIVGMILFLVYIFIVFVSNKRHYRITIFLFIAPFLISMGEMVFFSTNNIGILCYVYLAIYFNYDELKGKR